MASTTIFCFLLLSLSFPLNQPLIFVNGDMSLIQKTCKNTKNNYLCVSSLKSNATSTKTDTRGLALIVIGIGMANATTTSSYLSSQLLGTTTNDTILEKIQKKCADKYAYATNSLQDSVQDLAIVSYDYAYMHVMAAADYPNAGHNAFRRYQGLPYPPEIAQP